MLAYLSKFEPKLNQVGTKLAQDASILSQVGLPKKAFLSEEKTSWSQVGLKSVPQGPRCLSQRVCTSTHLTFIIENAHSPNFQHRAGALRMQKWPPRPPKMTKNPPQKQPQMTLKRFYQHMHFSLQPPRYAYVDLRHEVCGAGVHACVFNISIITPEGLRYVNEQIPASWSPAAGLGDWAWRLGSLSSATGNQFAVQFTAGSSEQSKWS